MWSAPAKPWPCSQRYDMNIATLRSANNLKSDELKIGQDLRIPSSEVATQQ